MQPWKKTRMHAVFFRGCCWKEACRDRMVARKRSVMRVPRLFKSRLRRLQITTIRSVSVARVSSTLQMRGQIGDRAGRRT